MKVLAKVTLVVNKTEYAPDMEVEISNEKEAESLIERGFASRIVKNESQSSQPPSSSSSKQDNSQKSDKNASKSTKNDKNTLKKMKKAKRRLITVVQQFQKAVDHLFKKLGKNAKYQNRDVLVFLLRPDMVVSVGFSQAHTATNMMKMRISDAPYLQIGEKLYCDNKEYTVSQEPLKDTNNLTWSFEVICT